MFVPWGGSSIKDNPDEELNMALYGYSVDGRRRWADVTQMAYSQCGNLSAEISANKKILKINMAFLNYRFQMKLAPLILGNFPGWFSGVLLTDKNALRVLSLFYRYMSGAGNMSVGASIGGTCFSRWMSECLFAPLKLCSSLYQLSRPMNIPL